MKIIAHMSGTKYLAEITSTELRELNSDIKVEIGAEYKILEAAKTLSTLRSLRRNKLEYIGDYINDLQAKFEDITEAYDALMMLDNIKNSENKNDV